MKVEPVAWMDDFGNAFPLAANKGAGSWRDEHKRDWRPLYDHAIPPGYALVRVEQVKDAREIVAKEYANDRHNARLYKAMDLLDMALTAAKGE